MAVGVNAERCLGPGICAGHGMPADTAVCQFPMAPQEKYEVPCTGPCHGPLAKAQASPSATVQGESKVCAGSGICPGAAICPTCKDDILHHLRPVPGKGEFAEQPLDPNRPRTLGQTASCENLLRQINSMILLPRDLDDLRQQVKVKIIIQ
jgi:hypothetical protein